MGVRVVGDKIAPAEFEQFAPSRRTLRQFIGACAGLNAQIRDVMLPDPDKS